MIFHKIWLNIFHKFFMLPFLKLIIGGDFLNTESIKETKQCIFIANHTSHADTAAILCSLPLGRVHRVHPVAARDYFGRHPIIAMLFKFFMNLLLIDRYKKDGSDCAIETMVAALDQGKSLIIFPEGSRVTDDKLKKFKKGVVKVLRERPTIPYIPIYIKSSAHVMPKGDPLVIPYNFKLKVGETKYINQAISDDDNISIIKNEILEIKKSLITSS